MVSVTLVFWFVDCIVSYGFSCCLRLYLVELCCGCFAVGCSCRLG